MKKILLVEDDPIMIRMYGRMFGYQGFEVEMAENGEEGLRKAREKKPDLILLDVMMPRMNGLELLEKLKADKELKLVKVVLLTNLGVQEEIDKALQKGVVKVITKADHDPQTVVEIIKDILDNQPES